MNKLFLILTISISIFSCNLNKKHESNLNVKVNIGNKLRSEKDRGNNVDVYPLSIDLINNTDSPLTRICDACLTIL